MQRRRFAMSVLAGGGLLTVGCGGGGGEPESSAPAPGPAPAPGDDFQPAAFVYVANPGEASVSAYGFSAGGTWKALGTVQAEAGTTSLAVHPSGRFAYATNSDSRSVSSYERDLVSGLLTPIGSQPVQGRPRRIRFHPSAESALVLGGGVSICSADDGVMREEGFFGTNGTVMDSHPSGEFLFVGGDPLNRHISFRVEGTSLVQVNQVAGVGLPANFEVAPSGNFLYTGARTDGRVVFHAIDGDGSIGSAGFVEVDRYIEQIRIHPLGRFAYASTGNDELGRIAILDLDSGTGAPTRRELVEIGLVNSPSLTMSPSGRLLFAASVAETDNNSLIAFAIDGNGALTRFEQSVSLGAAAGGVCVVEAGTLP